MAALPVWMQRDHYQPTDLGTVWHKDESVVIDIDAGRDPAGY